MNHDCAHHLLDHEAIEVAGNDDWAVTVLGPCATPGCGCKGETQ